MDELFIFGFKTIIFKFFTNILKAEITHKKLNITIVIVLNIFNISNNSHYLIQILFSCHCIFRECPNNCNNNFISKNKQNFLNF